MPDQGDKIDFNPSEIKSEKREDVLAEKVTNKQQEKLDMQAKVRGRMFQALPVVLLYNH